MRILFFAQIKDVTKCDFAELPLAAPINTEQFWDELLKKFPELAKFRSSTRLAKNSEYADEKTLFCDSDEIALIPPVSGG